MATRVISLENLWNSHFITTFTILSCSKQLTTYHSISSPCLEYYMYFCFMIVKCMSLCNNKNPPPLHFSLSLSLSLSLPLSLSPPSSHSPFSLTHIHLPDPFPLKAVLVVFLQHSVLEEVCRHDPSSLQTAVFCCLVDHVLYHLHDHHLAFPLSLR